MTSSRKIIHIDMDCFFAAIEIRNQPHLQDKPVAVGGAVAERGVICTCNYVARKYGIHSAMPTRTALRQCPQLILLPVNMPEYQKTAQRIRSIFQEVTPLVEPLSLDEAYLDVTQCKTHQGSATLIAQALRARIWEMEQLTASAGVAPNKFLAKIASGWQKPNGLFVIAPHQVEAFLRDLPVTALFGVGKVTSEKLQKLGMNTCTDLQRCSRTMLIDHFGKFGQLLYDQCRGMDDRPVTSTRIRKSLSVEHTFSTDLFHLETGMQEIQNLFGKLMSRIENSSSAKGRPIHGITLKIKFSDFELMTLTRMAPYPTLDLLAALFKEVWRVHQRPIRLIGIGVRFKEPVNDGEPLQRSLEL